MFQIELKSIRWIHGNRSVSNFAFPVIGRDDGQIINITSMLYNVHKENISHVLAGFQQCYM